MSPPPPLPVVLITGCSAGGIGFELARALAASGAARVIATARDVSKMKGLEAVAKAKGGDGSDGENNNGGGGGILALVRLDVTDDASVAAAAAEVLELTGGHGCDVLVNNAGMTFKGTLLDSSVAETARLFDANVFGLLRATQAFSKQMVARGRGLVANVGSATGYIHQATKSSYSASKHAVRCLTDSLRVELAPFNVRVVLVSPGYVATPIDLKAGAQGRWFAPKVGESPYAPPASVGDAAARTKTGAAASSSSSSGSNKEEEGFKEICTATRSSIFEHGVGKIAGAMPPGAFAEKLAAVLREWKKTFPAKGRVSRPPTMREYLASGIWLPTLLGGPVRHWREVRKRRKRERERERESLVVFSTLSPQALSRSKTLKKIKTKNTGPLRLGHLLYRRLPAAVAAGHAPLLGRRADFEGQQVK